MKRLITYTNAIAPPILWGLLIYSFSAQEALPGFDSNVYDFILKKCAHIFVYAVLYFLTYRGLELVMGKKYQSKIWLFAFIFCLIYAITDELHQTTVPGRTGTIRDIGFDMLGASLVFLYKFRYI